MAFGPVTLYSGAPNTGTDVSVLIVRNDTNAVVALGGRTTSIDITAKNTMQQSDGLDNGGRIDHRVIPSAGEVAIGLDRYNGDLEKLAAFLDAGFYAGGGQIYCTITVTTNNAFDQSQDRYKLTQAVLDIQKFGAATRAAGIKPTLTAYYQEKLPA